MTHGSVWGYRQGCRCEPCKQAHTADNNRRRLGVYIADRRPALTLTPEAWHDRAACKGMDPDLFVPQREDTMPKECATVCAACEVRKACLDYAMRTREPFGIYGGTTPAQRRSIRRRQNRKAQRVRNLLREAAS